MKKLLTFFAALLILFSFTLCTESHEDASTRYFRFLNGQQSDSLQLLLTPDFKVTLTYATYFYNRADFFSKYLKNLKDHNEKTRIVKTLSDKEPKQFLVEDSSDYLKYLNIGNPTWIVTVKSQDDKISEVIVDTTKMSRQFFKDVKEKSDHFHEWLEKKYSYQSPSILFDTAGLLLKRLREYKQEN